MPRQLGLSLPVTHCTVSLATVLCPPSPGSHGVEVLVCLLHGAGHTDGSSEMLVACTDECRGALWRPALSCRQVE